MTDNEPVPTAADQPGSPAGSVIVYTNQQFEVLGDFTPQDRDDLPLRRGEIVSILQTRSDGWWRAKNSGGATGWVPSTFLRVAQPYEEIPTTEPEQQPQQSTGQPQQPTGQPQQPTGQPLTQTTEQYEVPRSQPQITPSPALDGLPATWRPSVLRQAAETNTHNTAQCTVAPKLANSNLGFQDLFWNFPGNKLRKRRVKMSKIIRVTQVANAANVDLPESVKVTSRHVRVAFFARNRVIGNIHIVRARTLKKDKAPWTFSEKLTDKDSVLDCSEFLLRANMAASELGLLIEVCTALERSEQTNSEICVGWVVLPLFKEDGTPALGNGPQTLELQAGNANQPLPLDPSLVKKGGICSPNPTPRITIRVSEPNNQQRDIFDQLPDVLIWDLMSVHLVSKFRRFLAVKLLRDAPNTQTIAVLGDPVLAEFPRLLDQKDMIDLLLKILNTIQRERSRNTPALNDDDETTEFVDVVQNSIVALNDSSPLPEFDIANEKTAQKRKRQLETFYNAFDRGNRSAFDFFATLSDVKPFFPEKHTFSILNAHSFE